MRYFQKDVPTRGLLMPNGKRLEFEFYDPNQPGFLKTEDQYVISQIENAVRNRVGGVHEVTEAEYAVFLKKKSELQLKQPSVLEQPFRVISQLPFGVRAVRAAEGDKVADVSKPTPKPIEVPVSFPKLGPPR